MAYSGYTINMMAEHELKIDYEQSASSKKQEMQRCPICNVLNDYITNAHCQIEHGMTKKEVEAEYGEIVVERLRIKREKEMMSSAK